ncbi:MAG TPA: amino acid adenylation domain-containing protein, partial [Ktedonobacteraceae bacterium]|nr:amino acid adenylation domain-containing protein [Ktedonobacteraceae bacterium]
EQTQERFVPHLFHTEPGARLYRTGDLVRHTADGLIEFLGRADTQVKLRGFRIELGEIEAAISQHPGTRECVVLLREDASDEPRLVAYIVTQPQQTIEIQEIRSFLQERLPAYMLPSAIIFLPVLPLTSNGKVDRSALPEPEGEHSSVGLAYVGARGPIEKALVDIWKDVLKLKRLGIHDNFFEIGGHSLLATRVISRLRAVLQVDLSVLSLFEAPTVALLAEYVLRSRQDIDMPHIEPIERGGNLPLSFAQQRLWFLDQLEPGSASYNIPSAVELIGNLDIEAFERSLKEIVQRHEILRTTFHMYDGSPVQTVHSAELFQVQHQDISDTLPEAYSGRADLIRQLAEEEAQRPFDLTKGPLIRTTLLHVDKQRSILLLTTHHIVSDGWSTGVFVRELSALYTAFVSGQPSPLPALPLQYADFAAWQQQWLQGATLERQLDYWKKQLDGVVPLDFPTDYPRPAVQTFKGARQTFIVPSSLSGDLKRVSQREQVTLFMLLLAVFQVLLARWSGQQEIVVGTPIANRTRAEVEGLIGFFVNTLVLRTSLAGNPSLRDLLGRVRETALGAYAHQDVPFEKLVEVLQPERDLSRSPLFQVMFILQGLSQSLPDLPYVQARPLESDGAAAKFDLTLVVVERAEDLLCGLEYNTDLFEPASMTRLLAHWQSLLEAVVTSLEQGVQQLPILSAIERQQVLVDWNQTRMPFPLETSLVSLIAAQAQRVPERTALWCGERRLSYRALEERSNQLAHLLVEQGVGPEVLVGLYQERSLELIVSMLAIFKAGGAYVPLDPAYPTERLAWVLQETQVQVVLTQPNLAGVLAAHAVTAVELSADWRELTAYPVYPLADRSHPAGLAYVIYTSGSTGRPKGAMVTQGGMLNHLLAKIADLQLGEQDRLAQTASPCFDISVWQCFAALLLGGQVHILPDAIAHDASALLEAVVQQQVQVLEVVPSLLRSLLEVVEQSAEVPELALRWLVVTGEAFPAALCQRWQQRFPGMGVVNAYGPTECADDVTHACLTTPLRSAWASVPIGRAIANTRLYVLDEYLAPVPIGVVGQLYVGGAGVGRGYWGEPGQTASVFVPDLYAPEQEAGGRLYQTGDRVRYLAEGQLEFLGRTDHQVKVRGYRIELEEIEAVLGEHEGVQACCVLVREDTPGDQRLVGYVVTRQQPAPPPEALRQQVRRRVPEYMVPAHLVYLEQLPLTANGKLDRASLPAPTVEGTAPLAGGGMLSTPLEEIVASSWAEVLGRERIGRYDQFFELGGHSLLATQVASRLRQRLGIALPLRLLFEAPRVVEQARRIEGLLAGTRMEQPALEPISREQPMLLSFAQQRLWFLHQLDPDSSAYNIPAAARLQGTLNVNALEKSLKEIVRRHEILRTTFQEQGGEPLQVIHPQGEIHVLFLDLSTLASEVRELEAQRLAHEEAAQAFDLIHGPLLRTVLLRLNVKEHILLHTTHHIINDGWSNGVFMRELQVLYTAFIEEKPSPLPGLTIQYADFAAWQRQWLQGEALEAQLSYWRKQLRGASTLQLPADRPRSVGRHSQGASHVFRLPAQLCQDLVKLSRQEGV